METNLSPVFSDGLKSYRRLPKNEAGKKLVVVVDGCLFKAHVEDFLSPAGFRGADHQLLKSSASAVRLIPPISVQERIV